MTGVQTCALPIFPARARPYPTPDCGNDPGLIQVWRKFGLCHCKLESKLDDCEVGICLRWDVRNIVLGRWSGFLRGAVGRQTEAAGQTRLGRDAAT